MPSFITPLSAPSLTAAHRDGREKHNEHDRYGDHDYDYSRPYGQRDRQGGVHSVFLLGDFPGRMIPARRGTLEAAVQS